VRWRLGAQSTVLPGALGLMLPKYLMPSFSITRSEAVFGASVPAITRSLLRLALDQSGRLSVSHAACAASFGDARQPWDDRSLA
jgi:hypothetical protein